MRYLLDTSVYSQALRRNPIQAALRRWQGIGDALCAVSRVSVSEVEWGLHYEDKPQLWKKFDALLKNRLTVLPVSDSVWALFAVMKARQQKLGEPVSDPDLLIAAAAKERGLTVATLNRQDFSRIEGLAWENWSL